MYELICRNVAKITQRQCQIWILLYKAEGLSDCTLSALHPHRQPQRALTACQGSVLPLLMRIHVCKSMDDRMRDGGVPPIAGVYEQTCSLQLPSPLVSPVKALLSPGDVAQRHSIIPVDGQMSLATLLLLPERPYRSGPNDQVRL